MNEDHTMLTKEKDARIALRAADASWAVLALLSVAFLTSRALFEYRLVSRSVEFAVWIFALVAAIARVFVAKRITRGE